MTLDEQVALARVWSFATNHGEFLRLHTFARAMNAVLDGECSPLPLGLAWRPQHDFENFLLDAVPGLSGSLRETPRGFIRCRRCGLVNY